MLFHSLAEYRARGVPKKLPVADTVVNEWVVFIKNCGLMFGMRIFPHHMPIFVPQCCGKMEKAHGQFVSSVCFSVCLRLSGILPLLTLQAVHRVLVCRVPVLVGDGQQRYATDDQQGHREDPPIAGDTVGEAL